MSPPGPIRLIIANPGRFLRPGVFPASRLLGSAFILWLWVIGGASSTVAMASESTIFTLWPLVDYRSSVEQGVSHLNLLGPFIKYDKSPKDIRYGLRPLFFHIETPDGKSSYNDYLYPVATQKKETDYSSFQLIHLLSSDFGQRESGSRNQFMLFPFIFYNHPPEGDSSFALFPIGGTIDNKFGKDHIAFALFPLYSRTEKGNSRTTHVLWPIFSRTVGEYESGWEFWPLFGNREKTNVYRKSFFLWPFFFSNDRALDSENPVRERIFFPLYASEESPQFRSHTYVWPFFSHVENFQKGYEEWNFPWPLVRISRGDYRNGERFLPVFADERIGANRKRWFLWPLYKIEETHTQVLNRRRDRLLYFLYSDLEERVRNEALPRKRRVSLWPLFTYQNQEGVAHFYTLSVLEPFFPDNERIERNWSPLWRLYQVKWDGSGNEISSFLWNLYWKERRGTDLAMELFPLFNFRREQEHAVGLDFSLLMGLVRYRSNPSGNCLTFLYLPWGIHWEGSRPVSSSSQEN